MALVGVLLFAGCGNGSGGTGSNGATGSTAGTSGGSGSATYADDRSAWPEGLGALVDGLAAYRGGAALDSDGDGTPDITVDSSSGVRVETVDIDNGGTLSITFTDADHISASGDLNGDGTPDYSFSQVHSGNTATETTQEDTDFDGTTDRVTTRTFDLSARTYSFEVQALQGFADGGSGMVVVDQRQEGLGVHARHGPRTASCDELDGFPSGDTDSQYYPFGHANTNVRIDEGPGSCTSDQAQRIGRVMRQAVSDAEACLKNSNPELYSQFMDALSDRALRVSCGPDCTDNGSPVLATTDLGGDWTDPNSWFGTTLGNQRMGLNMDGIGADDGALEDVLIHEMLHWSGDPHKGGSDGAGGKDDVYGCGRYCSKCPGGFRTLAPSGHTFGADCAQCSDSAHKDACGEQSRNVQADCTQAALCHAGLAGNDYCTTCEGSIQTYCDGTPVPGTPALPDEQCCPANACASGETGPDIVCQQGFGVTQDCGTPPFCQ